MQYYKDRQDAAQQLIPFLERYRTEPGVVLAVPRGGVPIAFPIAQKFGFPLELLMTKKIGHPANPEFAVGAVSLEDYIIDRTENIPAEYLSRKITEIRASLLQKLKMFRGDHKPVELAGKTIIIIDDGIATGNTILSSIQMLRRKNPKRIIVAVPVAPIETVVKIRSQVDDLICPYTPEPFIGVGYHYSDFSEVSDTEVKRLLQELDEMRDAA